ncbi:MAG: hypothetical protein ACE5HJ_03740 [Thermoplasmata archaeon]
MGAREGRGPGIGRILWVTVIVAVVAIALSAVALSASYAPEPQRTQKFTVVMGEGEIIGENPDTGEEEIIGEFHRWEPAVLVVNKGDLVILTVKNPRSHNHSFVLEAFGVDTGTLPGKLAQPPGGSEVEVQFVPDKAGVFRWKCGVEHVHDTWDCDEDHVRMVGYLVVLA